jgi:hypothetical protein
LDAGRLARVVHYGRTRVDRGVRVRRLVEQTESSCRQDADRQSVAVEGRTTCGLHVGLLGCAGGRVCERPDVRVPEEAHRRQPAAA